MLEKKYPLNIINYPARKNLLTKHKQGNKCINLLDLLAFYPKFQEK